MWNSVAHLRKALGFCTTSLKPPEPEREEDRSLAHEDLHAIMHYRQLDEGREIRLLEILQLDDPQLKTISRDSRPAEYRLKHTPFHDASSDQSIALNYVWGDEDSLEDIVLDGFSFVVRRNL
jgi:hypothetical protein